MPDDPTLTIHRFSQEVFEVAREFALGKQAAGQAQQKMDELRGKFPELADLAATLPEELQDDARGVLSEASMELSYVESEGALPASRRLGRLLREQSE
jgi:hypothetical protein